MHKDFNQFEQLEHFLQPLDNYNKEIESSMYFRNITMINKNSEIVCPHCKKVHETKNN